MSTAGRMFQLQLDPITGNSEWVVIEDEEEDEDEGFFGGPTKPMLATTSYLDMLNDNPRNRAYRAAIDKVVTKPCHVLDIGAGTGLLSMMAARAMEADNSSTCVSSKGMVTSCESYLPMVKLMRKVLRGNCMEHKVLLINKRSDELEVGVNIASRADVLVSEILDSELLGEGLIPTLQHAHEKLLVENPQTVPYRATTYGQLVESTYLWKLHDLFRNEEKVGDGIYLVPKGMERIIGVKPQQFAMHCDAMKEDIQLLSEPFKVFDFDFWKRPNSNGEAELQVRAIGDGTVHAVISWWILQLESEGKIFYSTAPKWINTPLQFNNLQSSIPCARTWCDHWKQCVWFSPGKGLSVCKDENICLDAIHTNTSISYIFKAQPPRPEIDHLKSCTQDYQITLSPERIAIYGDNNWRFSMLKAIKTALHKNGSPLCVVADDSVFLTIAVAQLSRTSHVMSLFPGLREKGSQYLQAVAVENGYSMDRVGVVSKRKQQLSMDDTHHKKVDLLIAEPFYYGCEGMLPWQNLKFWNKRTILDSVLSEDVQVIPWKGILRASAMCLPDLWRSRRSLKEIEGFDHSVVNTTLGGCGDLTASHEIPCLPFFIWQCGEVKKLSEIHTIMEFDFLKPITACCGKVQIEFTEPGICHGFALWIDWIMDTENSIVVSTGPDQRYWKQGVKLLNKPVAVEKRCASSGGHYSTIVEAYFDPLSGVLSLKHEFS